MKKWIFFSVLGVGILFFASVSYADSDIETLAQGCLKCHKVGQAGKTPDLTTLSKKDFLEKMKKYADSNDGGMMEKMMQKKAKGLSQEQTNQLADYFQKK